MEDIKTLPFADEDNFFKTSLILDVRELKLLNNLLVHYIVNNPSDEDIQEYKWLQENTYNNFMNDEPIDQKIFENKVIDNVEYLDKQITAAVQYGLDVRDIVMKSVALLVEVATQDSTNLYEGVLLLEEAKKDIIEGNKLPGAGVTYVSTPITVYGVLISGEPIHFDTLPYKLPVYEKNGYPERFEILKQYLNYNKILTEEPIDNYYIHRIEAEDDNFEFYAETWYITTK